MTLESFLRIAHALPEVTEDFPFGPEVLAIRVNNKIFALMNVEQLPLRANLKCDPEWAVQLRAEYEGVIPGYHMNKTHWNTVSLDGDLPGSLLRDLIEESWERVVDSMPKKHQTRLRAMRSE